MIAFSSRNLELQELTSQRQRDSNSPTFSLTLLPVVLRRVVASTLSESATYMRHDGRRYRVTRNRSHNGVLP
ncbi:hypothetical protein RJZ56_003210 [Blastomyces dermatitidis]